MSLPVIDIHTQSDEGLWSQALAGTQQRRAAAQLVKAMRAEAEKLAGRPRLTLAKAALSALHSLLGRHYGDEIEDLAGVLGVARSEVILANVVYDYFAGAGVGCSTFVADTPQGPLHARNLDWPFPRQLLRKHTAVLQFLEAPHGNYASITWPGLFGVFTGIAPRRFSVTVNYVKHATESGVGPALKRALRGYWPTTWATRQVFDECQTFDAAVEYLRDVPLMAPVLFTVAGIGQGLGVVIERTPDDAVVRRMMGGAPVCVTNHYVSDELIDANLGIEQIDTVERLEALERGLAGSVVHDAPAALKILCRRALQSDITVHTVAMRAADGTLVVRVPGQRAMSVDLG